MTEPGDKQRSRVRAVRPSRLELPVLTGVQARAMMTVQQAIGDALERGETVPCLADPQGWDADRRVTRADLTRMVRLCLSSCPVLAECRAFGTTDPPVIGVCAGTYRPHKSDLRRGRPVTPKVAWAQDVAADIANEQATAGATDTTDVVGEAA